MKNKEATLQFEVFFFFFLPTKSNKLFKQHCGRLSLKHLVFFIFLFLLLITEKKMENDCICFNHDGVW